MKIKLAITIQLYVPVHDDALRQHDVPEVPCIVTRDAEILQGVATIVVWDLHTQQNNTQLAKLHKSKSLKETLKITHPLKLL